MQKKIFGFQHPLVLFQRTVHPGVKDPGEKFFMHTQVGPFLAIFWQNHPGVY